MLDLLLINKPIFTEKSEKAKNSDNIYSFKVAKRANKIEIKKLIESIYKVKVENVRIINMAEKSVIRAGKTGVKPGYKKALVKLKKGEKIENI